MGYSCRTLWWDTLVGHSGHSCRALLSETLLGHSCGTLLWATLVGHSCRALLVGHSYRTLSWDTVKGHSCARLPPKVTRQVSSKTSVSYETSSIFLQKSHVKSPKRAFRTRLPQKVTGQVCKTSVSYETSSKSQAETPIGAHTSRSPANQFRDSSPSNQHPLTRQSHWDSDLHSQPDDSLRLPRIFPCPHV